MMNNFYTHFEAAVNSTKAASDANSASGANGSRQKDNGNSGTALIISKPDVRKTFRRVNIRQHLRSSSQLDQLEPVFMVVFNLSLSQSIIPTCFREAIIVPVSKKTHPACLYHPGTLTSDSLEVRGFIIPYTFYTVQTNGQMMPSHTSYKEHWLTRKGNYVKLLFVDYSLAFNTIKSKHCWAKARKLVKYLSHPSNGFFFLLPSGKCFHSLKAKTERLSTSCFRRLFGASTRTAHSTKLISLCLLHTCVGVHYITYHIAH